MHKRNATTADVVAYMTALHLHDREAAGVAIAGVDRRSFVMKLESVMFMLFDFVAEQTNTSVEGLLEQGAVRSTPSKRTSGNTRVAIRG